MKTNDKVKFVGTKENLRLRGIKSEIYQALVLKVTGSIVGVDGTEIKVLFEYNSVIKSFWLPEVLLEVVE